MHELGWIEGRTLAIEYRWSEGRPERIDEIAAEFVNRNVDVIVTNDSSAPTMKQATSVIPIVFVLGNDPLGTGLVTNLARPGANVTGLSVQQTETDSKRLELLREVVPRLRRVAIMANVGHPASLRQARELRAAAGTLGLEVVPLDIRRAEDIAGAFAALNAQADALYIVQDALAVANMARIMTFALPRACRRLSIAAISFRLGLSCHTEQAYQPCSAARLTLLTGFCAGRSREISRLSSPRNSNWSSICPPPRRSGLPSRQMCSQSPTR
jgi:hypothetical protein